MGSNPTPSAIAAPYRAFALRPAEAIDLTRYYLAHDSEREAIARAGYRRSIRDYNEIECHRKLLATVTSFLEAGEPRTVCERGLSLATQFVASGTSSPRRPAVFRFGKAVRRLVQGASRRATFTFSVGRLRALRAARAVFHHR